MDRVRPIRADGAITYRFHRVPGHNCFAREDAPKLTIARDEDWGWVARLPKTGEIAGVSVSVPPRLQGATPSEGAWGSRRGAKSYVYELRHD